LQRIALRLAAAWLCSKIAMDEDAAAAKLQAIKRGTYVTQHRTRCHQQQRSAATRIRQAKLVPWSPGSALALSGLTARLQADQYVRGRALSGRNTHQQQSCTIITPTATAPLAARCHLLRGCGSLLRRDAREVVKKRRAEAEMAAASASSEEEAAAAKLQAIKRGTDAREQVKAKRAEAEAEKAAAWAEKEAAAQARLAAGAQGYVARKQKKKEDAAMTRLQANYRGKKERSDPQSKTNVMRERSKNDPGYQSEVYMRDHKLLELFDLLGQKLVSSRPSNPREFLIQELTKLKSTRVPSSPLNFFSPDDIETLFSMYDVSGDGLTPFQCREALTAMGLEEIQVPVGKERFDRNAFFAILPKM